MTMSRDPELRISDRLRQHLSHGYERSRVSALELSPWNSKRVGRQHPHRSVQPANECSFPKGLGTATNTTQLVTLVSLNSVVILDGESTISKAEVSMHCHIENSGRTSSVPSKQCTRGHQMR